MSKSVLKKPEPPVKTSADKTTESDTKQEASFAGVLTAGIVTLLALIILLCLWNFIAAFASLHAVDPELDPVDAAIKTRSGGGGEEIMSSLPPIPYHRFTAENYKPFATLEEQDAYYINQSNIYPQPQPETFNWVPSSPSLIDHRIRDFLQPGMYTLSGNF